MKTVLLAAFLFLPAGSLSAALLLADNFNALDNTNFDNSDQTGRRSGLIGPDVQLRSSRFQHGISNNELLLGTPASGSGRVRFHTVSNLANWHDFASGPGGAAMLADGGFRMEFDWRPVVLDNDNWIAVTVGIAPQSVAEPGVRVNHSATDFGILFRHNGGTQYFDSGAATTGPAFTTTTDPIHIALEYRFDSFADGSPVSVSAWAGATSILTDSPFLWEDNNGSLFLEFGSYQAGNRIDNFQLSTIPEPSAALLAGLAAGAVVIRRQRRR